MSASPLPPAPVPVGVPAAAVVPGGLHPALQRMLVETVSHAAYVSQDAYGKPTYAAPVTRPARVEYKVTTVADAQGQARMSMTKVFLNGDCSIGLRDKLTLPDGTAPAIQAILSPRKPFRPAEVSHHEVLL